MNEVSNEKSATLDVIVIVDEYEPKTYLVQMGSL